MNTGNYKTNFSCNILSAVADDSTRPGDPLVTFTLVVDGRELPEVHRLRLHEFKTVDFETLDIHCQCIGDRKAFGQDLYTQIRQDVAARDAHTCLFADTGWTKLNDVPVYVAGNRVIGPEGWILPCQYALAPELEALTLEVDASISEPKAARYVRRLCQLHPGVTDMLVASAVVAHLFTLFEAAGVRPRLTMYVVGPSMIGKTTLVRLVGQTYNRSASDDPHLVNLISTTAAIYSRVSALNDCVCIVDDLYPSNSLAETRRREERLGEIIRTTGNGAAKEKMDGKQASPQISRGVVFSTAEYSLPTFSTVARVVSLPLKSFVDRDALSLLQENPAMLSTFWFYFIWWVCGRYDELADRIRLRFSELRQQGRVHSGMDRLLDAHMVLTIGMEVLTDYLIWAEPDRVKTIGQTRHRFLASSGRLYLSQMQELQKLQSRTDGNRFSRFLAELYFSGQIEKGKKKKLGAKHPTLIAKGLLYIRLDCLAGMVRTHYNDPTVTPQSISAELRKNGLLKMDRSGRSSKKVGGVRYLQIPVDRLEEFLPSTPFAPSLDSLNLELSQGRSINSVDQILYSRG